MRAHTKLLATPIEHSIVTYKQVGVLVYNLFSLNTLTDVSIHS